MKEGVFMEEVRSLAQLTADRITEYILKHDFKEGAKLPSEGELGSLLEVSRTTLREAVRMLTSRNILEVRHGSGIFISKNTGISDDPLGFAFVRDKEKLVADLLEFRMLVEPRIAARAAQNATEEQAVQLSSLADAVEEQYALGLSHTQEDTAFHAKLGELSGSVVFPNLAPIIFRAISMFIDVTSARLKEETISSHRDIVNAVRKHDPLAAEDAMYLHLIYNRNRLERNREEEPLPINCCCSLRDQ